MNVFYIGKQMILMTILSLFLPLGMASHVAAAGKIDVQSIQIRPAETTTGKYPDIIVTIKAASPRGAAETTEVNLIATVIRPDNSVKSWNWKHISIKDGEAKGFSIPKDYDVKLEGVYKVDFGIYSKDMRPLHKLSKTFTVLHSGEMATSSTGTTVGKTKGGGVVSGSTGTAAGKTAGRPIAPAGTATAARKAPYQPVHVNRFGIGLTGNFVNAAAGATLLYWPSRNVGLQASYSMGSFTITEARVLARFPLSSGFNPYLGIGYSSVTTERAVDVINIKTTFSGSGVSGALGVEVPLGKRVMGYVEVNGSNIDLQKELNSGGMVGIAKVDYSPVSVGFSIVYFFY